MLRKSVIALAVIISSALAVVLVYPVLGFYFLLPGSYLAQVLPTSWVTPSETGPSEGAFVIFIISFLVWWPMLSAVGCVYFLRKRSAPGA